MIRVQQDRERGYDKEFLPIRRAPGRTGGRFRTRDGRWHSLPTGWLTKRPSSDAQDLYRAPFLRRAKLAGEVGPVYLPEGHSDADALAEQGVLTVTEGSATAAWHEHYTELLDGLDIVIILDRDDEGIRRGERLARRLADRARSVRVTQPRQGKDLRDHLAAGYALSDLREVDLAIPGVVAPATLAVVGASETTVEETTRPERDEPPNQLPNEYLVRRGELVERIWRDGNPVYRTVLRCVAWVEAVSEEDNGTDQTRYQRPTRDVRITVQRHDEDGALQEQRQVRIAHDQVSSGKWVHEWPYPDTFISRSRRGADKALDAIYTAHTAPTRRTPVYTATGWRRTDTGWLYVHGAGAIGRGGSLPDLDVDIDGVLQRAALPEPTTDATELRDAYAHGTACLRQLPARLGAPLNGFVFRALIGGPQGMVLHLHGPRGTGKTAASRLFLQHTVPELRYPHVKEFASGSSNLSSPKGMQRLLGAAKDLPLEIDDLAPDRGGAAEAQTRLAELARQTYNGSGQLKADRLPGKMVAELPPRCSLITTGEVTAGGSAETRCFNILVEPGAVPVELVAELETPSRCEARALLGASFVRWCAEHYDALTEWISELTSRYNAAWRHSLADLPHDDGIVGRLAEAAAGYTTGLALQVRFLSDMGALDDEEAGRHWSWGIGGIQTAARELDVDDTDPAVQLLGWTQEALATRIAHLTGARGGPPEIPDDEFAPARYGWTPQYKSSMLDTSPSVTWVPNGTTIGTVPKGDPHRAYLVPDASIEAARRVAARTETRWTESKAGFSAALDARGWIRTTHERGRTVRCPNRMIDGGSRRVWDLDRSLLDGQFHTGDESDGPQPLDPRLTSPPTTSTSIPSSHDDKTGEDPVTTDNSVSSEATERPIADDSAPQEPSHVAAPPVRANTEETTTMTASSTRSSGRVKHNDGDDWTYPLLVADTDAVYLPDDTTLNVDEDHLATFSDVAELADTLGVGQSAGPGQLWITKRLSDRMGLSIGDDEELPDPVTAPKKFNNTVSELLTERGNPLLQSSAAAGWHVGDDDGTVHSQQLRPRIRLHRPADGRVFTLVLAHYSTLWDPRRTGPDHVDHPLPEPDDDPVGYGLELARRAGRLATLIGQPWASSAGQMGAVLFDRVRARSRDKITTAGYIPDLGEIQGQTNLETIWSWWYPHQPQSLESVLRTPYVHRFDGRASWLVAAGSLPLGYGDPTHYTSEDELHQVLANDKLPFGTWRITLPRWEDASMLPPHPMMPSHSSTNDEITCWVTTPSLRLLIAHDHLDLDLPVHEAWIWPHQSQKLSTWKEQLRKILSSSWEQEAAAREALETASTEEAAHQAQRDLNTEQAVIACLKNVYSGYIGRMISPATKGTKERPSPRPWHHQPVWRHSIVAEARRRDYLKLYDHAQRTGVHPVAAIGTDEYWFLSATPDSSSVAPDVDDGRLGKLRAKGEVLELTDERARRLCGTPTDEHPHRSPTAIHRLFTTHAEGSHG